jgi:small subunit ribosomal protein S2
MGLPDAVKNLLEHGVHFGHLSKHWNPKMKRFIFGKKKNVYVIDLEKTAQKLEEAKDFVKSTAKKEGKILFVATKKQLRYLIKEQAESCHMPYMTERWVGGFLTNFSTIKTRVNRYLTMLERKKTGEFDKLSHKEATRVNRDLERMEKSYSGVAGLTDYPKCIIVVDPKKEMACVREANKLSIPIVALIDTDADPDMIDYPVPGNDDAIKSVGYVVSQLIEAIREGQGSQGVVAQPKEATDAKETTDAKEAQP